MSEEHTRHDPNWERYGARFASLSDGTHQHVKDGGTLGVGGFRCVDCNDAQVLVAVVTPFGVETSLSLELEHAEAAALEILARCSALKGAH